MDKMNLEQLMDSLIKVQFRLELSVKEIKENLEQSLEEIDRIKREITRLQEKDIANKYDRVIDKIDRDIANLEKEMNIPKREDVKPKLNIDELVREIDKKLDEFESNDNNKEKEEVDRVNYEQIGLKNYRNTKFLVENIMKKSKDISNKISNRKVELLLKLEKGETLNARNNNLDKYKALLVQKLEELETKKEDYYSKISELASLSASEDDKKHIIRDGLEGLLRYLSNLMLDFSSAKGSVKYYNVGKFYNIYEEMKDLLQIKPDKKEMFDSYLESLLAFSYQANVTKYDVDYANIDVVEANRINAILYKS